MKIEKKTKLVQPEVRLGLALFVAFSIWFSLASYSVSGVFDWGYIFLHAGIIALFFSGGTWIWRKLTSRTY